MTPHRLDRVEARRIAIRAQLLDAPRPTDLLEVLRQLTILQIDPTAAIAPNADLVAWTRLGSTYQPARLRQAQEHDRTVFEVGAMIRPMDHLRLHLPGMRSGPHHPTVRQWMDDNAAFHADVLKRLEASGPLLSRDIPDTSVVPWPSSGWTNNRNVTQMLEYLLKQGEVAVTARQGRQRVWDLAERVYPAVEPVPLEEADREKNERRVRSLGIVRPNVFGTAGEPLSVANSGEPATVDGIAGEWRVDPAAIGRPFTGRTALLSPFDRLIHDRVRALELFDFEYILEMYKPKDKRRWGYFALPILHDDRMVGKLDAKADRKGGKLDVFAIHEDIPFTKTMARDVNRELDDLAAWLELDLVRH